jgi:hypothetical protein
MKCAESLSFNRSIALFPFLIKVTPRKGEENSLRFGFVTHFAHKRGLRRILIRGKTFTMTHQFALMRELSKEEEVALDSTAREVSFQELVIFPGKIISNIAL